MQFKNAIDRIIQAAEFGSLEAKVSLDQMEALSPSRNLSSKVTKTDYLIFLREIHREAHQRLKVYGQYFEYSLTNKQEFPNAHRSKSSRK